MPEPDKPKEDTRLRRAGRWGAYGAGAGGVIAGGLSAIHTRSVPWSLLSGAEGAVKIGIPGAAIGAITYRKPKPTKELSSILDNLIEFDRGKQLLKQWSKGGGFTMPRHIGEAMDAVIRKDYKKFATFSPTATPEEVHAAMKFTRDKIAQDQWKWRGVRRKVSNLENMVNKLKEEHGLSSLLDDLIQFAEKKKDEKKPPTLNVIKARRSLMGTGAVVGAYAGGLISAEHGAGASVIGGAHEAMGKFTDYAKEDRARAMRKDYERYDTIEDRFGGTQKFLKGKEPYMGGGGAAGAFKAKAGEAARGVGKFAKELPRKSLYAAQDVGYGVGKWLTRASLSRGIAAGAVTGGLIGRYAGTKLGQQMDKASAARSRTMRQARIRRQATDIAKAHVMAKAIAEGITSKQQNMSAWLDSIISFQDTKPRNPGTGEYSGNAEGGPDPNAMARVYKMPPPQPPPQQHQQIGVGKAGAAALAGGALGAIGGQAGKTAWLHASKAIKDLAAKRKKVIK